MYIYMRERDFFFNELAHMIVEADKSRFWREAWQAGDLGKSW